MTDAIPLPRANPTLAKFRAALAEMYGDRLERVVFFGSRARGDARQDSDYDVAVFLNGMNGSSDRWAEADKIAAVTTDILSETGAFIHAMPYRTEPIQRTQPVDARNPARGVRPLTPEAARYLDKAQRCVLNAQTSLRVNLTNDAGRGAYLAAFHAAQALIFERTGQGCENPYGCPCPVWAIGQGRTAA